MVKRAIQQISMSLPSNLRASDPGLSNGWWRYHAVVMLSPYSRQPTGEKERKIEIKKKKLHLREVYQISSFTAFPGGSSMENAGLDPASSCSEHSCLRQGPGGTLPLFWRLKGMWGLWWPPAQRPLLLLGAGGGIGHLVSLGRCPCPWKSNLKLCPSVSFALGVCSVHFEL